jgi:hypothetical protein
MVPCGAYARQCLHGLVECPRWWRTFAYKSCEIKPCKRNDKIILHTCQKQSPSTSSWKRRREGRDRYLGNPAAFRPPTPSNCETDRIQEQRYITAKKSALPGLTRGAVPLLAGATRADVARVELFHNGGMVSGSLLHRHVQTHRSVRRLISIDHIDWITFQNSDKHFIYLYVHILIR